MRKAVIAHGGGPTAVLNASLAGAIEGCRGHGVALYGARFGLPGILSGDMPELSDARDIALAPGSAIGSSRARISEDDFERILSVLKREDIRMVFTPGATALCGPRSNC